jgi:hypothetical protein
LAHGFSPHHRRTFRVTDPQLKLFWTKSHIHVVTRCSLWNKKRFSMTLNTSASLNTIQAQDEHFRQHGQSAS